MPETGLGPQSQWDTEKVLKLPEGVTSIRASEKESSG